MGWIGAHLEAVAFAGLATGIVACGIALVLWSRVQRFAAPFDRLAAAARDGKLEDALRAQVQGVEENRRRIEETLAYTRRLRTQSLNALQGIGFLRYDAFDDIRGQQSYSVCLLDAHSNGIILSSIAGRADARAYAKPVRNGSVDMVISDEEARALDLAKESLGEIEEPIVAGL